jgi:hypothetical protein
LGDIVHLFLGLARNRLLRAQLCKDLVEPLRPPPTLLAFLLLRIARQTPLRLVHLHRRTLGERQARCEHRQDGLLGPCRGRGRPIDEHVGRVERRQRAKGVLTAPSQGCEPVAERERTLVATRGLGERDGDDGPGRLNVAFFERTGRQRGEVERDARAAL